MQHQSKAFSFTQVTAHIGQGVIDLNEFKFLFKTSHLPNDQTCIWRLNLNNAGNMFNIITKKEGKSSNMSSRNCILLK